MSEGWGLIEGDGYAIECWNDIEGIEMQSTETF